jgi:hypothetical protein
MQSLAQIRYTNPNGNISFSIRRDSFLEIVEISMYNSTHRYVCTTSIHQSVMVTLRHLLGLGNGTLTVQELSVYPSEGEHILTTENEQQSLVTARWSDVSGRFQLSLT